LGVAIVDLFLGNALNAVDAKGRVSLPSSYRSTIEKRQQRGAPAGGAIAVEKVVTFLAHPDRPCLVGFDNSVASEIVAALEARRAASDDAGDIFAMHEADLDQFSATWTVTYDPDGRMVMPGFLRAKAGIADLAFFLPAGRTFEMWAPDAFLEQGSPKLAAAREQLSYLLGERRK
jgi:MraZ protein